MRRRYSWDERQGDLFGAPEPKPAAAKRLAPTESEVPKSHLSRLFRLLLWHSAQAAPNWKIWLTN